MFYTDIKLVLKLDNVFFFSKNLWKKIRYQIDQIMNSIYTVEVIIFSVRNPVKKFIYKRFFIFCNLGLFIL